MKAGRKSKPIGERSMITTIRLSIETINKINRICENLGKSRGELIVDIVNRDIQGICIEGEDLSQRVISMYQDGCPPKYISSQLGVDNDKVIEIIMEYRRGGGI